MENGRIYITAGLGLLALLFLRLSHCSNRRRRLVEALPTSQVQGVFIGLVELKGTAESEAPFTPYLSDQPCVLYSWTVAEHWRRTVTETYTDSEGRTQTRTRVESGSSVVASGGESAPFYLKDSTGVLLVHPEGADLRPATLFSETCTPFNSLYYEKGPPGAIMDSTFTRTFTESGILLHSDIFLVGKARERSDIVAAEIAAEKESPLYLVTVQTEEQVLRGYGTSLRVWNVLGLLASGGAGWVFLQHWPAVFCAAGIYAGVWALTWVWMVYNSLVDTRNRVRQAWSLLDVQFKRRHDLIPNLIQCIDALKSHEQDVHEAVAQMRTQLTATAPGRSGPDFHGVARTVAGLAESYPALKTDAAFNALQKQLIGTEQRIALARAYYNDIATAYNTRIEVMPDALLAKLTGFAPRQLLSAEDFERAVVPVQLAP